VSGTPTPARFSPHLFGAEHFFNFLASFRFSQTPPKGLPQSSSCVAFPGFLNLRFCLPDYKSRNMTLIVFRECPSPVLVFPPPLMKFLDTALWGFRLHARSSFTRGARCLFFALAGRGNFSFLGAQGAFGAMEMFPLARAASRFPRGICGALFLRPFFPFFPKANKRGTGLRRFVPFRSFPLPYSTHS